MTNLIPHPRDFQPAIHRGYAAGLDSWYWNPCTANGRMIVEMLEGQRDEAIAAKVGGTFEEYEAQGRAAEYLDAMADEPGVQEILSQHLGNPDVLFGSVPPWIGDAHAARIKWKVICNTPVVQVAA